MNYDYVEYDNPEQATEASKELSYFIGFARDPEGTMEREEKEYLERMKNLPKGGLMEFIYGFREKGKAGSEPKSKSQIKGGDLRNLISEYGIMPGATPLFTKSVKSETGRPLVRPDEKKGALSQINWSSITWDNLKNIYGEITKETEIR